MTAHGGPNYNTVDRQTDSIRYTHYFPEHHHTPSCHIESQIISNYSFLEQVEHKSGKAKHGKKTLLEWTLGYAVKWHTLSELSSVFFYQKIIENKQYFKSWPFSIYTRILRISGKLLPSSLGATYPHAAWSQSDWVQTNGVSSLGTHRSFSR